MKSATSLLRILIFIGLAVLIIEYTSEESLMETLNANPVLWAVLGMILLFAIAMEVILYTLRTLLFRGLSLDAQEKYLAAEADRQDKQFGWWKRTYKKLVGGRPMAEEHEIILDHNYDGIKELDNRLPPWWVYGFYATILFAVIYLARYHIFDGTDQAGEYLQEVAAAQLEIAEYKRNNKDLVDVSTVELLTDPADLSAGKAIFTELCVACHKADGGGGIGPNLTDNYWILGGGIKNVFNTIMEGGRDGKGMISWKSELNPGEVAQVSSYLLQFEGTIPAEPKAPEGEIWIDPDAPQTGTEEILLQVVDSTAASVIDNE
ncbi:MAG: c-type cytochrome [Bacteroidia bacterium]|nr:c-type cytochrome [Bacteroidia bacterium]NNM22707.1 c-type cytochrome [Flavobacteriaceae bacterium]